MTAIEDFTNGRRPTKTTWYEVAISAVVHPEEVMGQIQVIAKFRSKGDAYVFAQSKQNCPDISWIAIRI